MLTYNTNLGYLTSIVIKSVFVSDDILAATSETTTANLKTCAAPAKVCQRYRSQLLLPWPWLRKKRQQHQWLELDPFRLVLNGMGLKVTH